MCEVACPWTYCIFIGETEHERLGLISRFFFAFYEFAFSALTIVFLCTCETLVIHKAQFVRLRYFQNTGRLFCSLFTLAALFSMTKLETFHLSVIFVFLFVFFATWLTDVLVRSRPTRLVTLECLFVSLS